MGLEGRKGCGGKTVWGGMERLVRAAGDRPTQSNPIQSPPAPPTQIPEVAFTGDTSGALFEDPNTPQDVYR